MTTTIPGVSRGRSRNAADDSGRLLTSGGRVLACVGMGDEVEEARNARTDGLHEISFDGAYYRRDIADLRYWPTRRHPITGQPIYIQ